MFQSKKFMADGLEANAQSWQNSIREMEFALSGGSPIEVKKKKEQEEDFKVFSSRLLMESAVSALNNQQPQPKIRQKSISKGTPQKLEMSYESEDSAFKEMKKKVA